jgi:hypothetical protein
MESPVDEITSLVKRLVAAKTPKQLQEDVERCVFMRLLTAPAARLITVALIS